MTPEDTEAIAALINANSQALVGTNRALIDERGRLRLARYIPEDAERWLVTDDRGDGAAFAFLSAGPPFVVVEVGIVVHPRFLATNLGEVLLHKLEERATKKMPAANQNVRVVMQTAAFRSELPVINRLESHGFHVIREWVHFELELTRIPAPPEWPEGITVRPFDESADWPAAGIAMDEAFSDHWGELKRSARAVSDENDDDEDQPEGEEAYEDPYWNSPGLCFVALHGDEVAGVCLSNARSIEWPDAGRLGSLSVRRPFRGRGLGLSLCAHTLREFYRRGTRRVVTDTDATSFTGANRLYPRLGFRPFRMEVTLEKELQPGVELRALRPEDLDR